MMNIGYGRSGQVGAVVVSYHPNIAAVVRLVRNVLDEVAWLVIVDNGSDLADVEQLKKNLACERVIICVFTENLGLATAQNRGISELLSRGADYILLLDQDSTPSKGMVRRLLDVATRLASQGVKLGAVGPISRDSRTGDRARFVGRVRGGIKKDGYIESDFLISSGTLISRAALVDVGCMNDGFFIDHIDTEWCLRARGLGWRLFYAPNAEMVHTLGDSVIRIWLLRRRYISVHSPVRNYYALRNGVLMLRTTRMSFSQRFGHILRILQFLIFFGLFVPPRSTRIKMMIRGLMDGVRGRIGRLEH